MNNYESGKEFIGDLLTQFNSLEKSSLNEANTRFKFIDEALMKGLGWDKNDISCEDSYGQTYTDYTLKLLRPVAVVEAKKAGDYFELPVGQKNLIQPLKTVYDENENLKSAIDQVKGYCQDRAIQIAIVSNGWQFIAFIAVRTDSVPPLSGNALVIPSLEIFYNEFKDVWNCLSKAGFEEEHLLKKLTGNPELQLPPKLSSTIYQYPGIKNRNPFQTEMEILSDLVLEDVVKEKDLESEFLDSCYCKSGALSNYSLVSKAILTTRYDFLFELGDKKATLTQVADKKGISKDLVELFANSLSKRPVLLIGDVGVGKSTFIDYLRLVEAPKVFNKAFSFKIDLGSRAIVTLDIRMAVIGVIKEQLAEQYGTDIEDDDFVRHCYSGELDTFKSSVKVKRLYDSDGEKAIEREIDFLTAKVENQAEHLKSALKYICKHQKKQIIVFIDNCDQRSDADQETAFLISQEFASEWPMLVFVSLRPETFHRTKRESGALSGYHTKAFTIPPPRLDEVIKKRLEFALKITSGEVALSKLDHHAQFSKLHSLIKMFLKSLSRNEDLPTFLSNVSNDNIRKAIELVKKFFGSGHVDMEKIISFYDEGGYMLPLHEMLRSIIYSDNIHYSSISSEIINVFEVRHYKGNDHFILLSLISLLDDYSRNSRNQGFISIDETFSYLQGVGYTSKQIDTVLNYAYAKKLFETSQKGDTLESNDMNLKIRATNLAVYHLRFLLKSFTYIDAIIVDTPIFNSETRAKIGDVMKIEDRLTRASIFRAYLDDQWETANLNNVHFNWPTFSNELKGDIEQIEARLRKGPKHRRKAV